jgi:acyl dehydratase
VLVQEDLTEFSQQITYRHSFLERPIENHHTDPALAVEAGFPAPVAEPLHYLALVDNAMLELYGTDWLERGSMEVAILGPVFAGDMIRIRLAAAETTDGDDQSHALTIHAPDGSLVTAGTVSITAATHAEPEA